MRATSGDSFYDIQCLAHFEALVLSQNCGHSMKYGIGHRKNDDLPLVFKGSLGTNFADVAWGAAGLNHYVQFSAANSGFFPTGGFLSHGGSASHHPVDKFGFSIKSTPSIFGASQDYGNLQVDDYKPKYR